MQYIYKNVVAQFVGLVRSPLEGDGRVVGEQPVCSRSQVVGEHPVCSRSQVVGEQPVCSRRAGTSPAPTWGAEGCSWPQLRCRQNVIEMFYLGSGCYDFLIDGCVTLKQLLIERPGARGIFENFATNIIDREICLPM